MISALTSFNQAVDVTTEAYQSWKYRFIQVYSNSRSKLSWWCKVKLRLLVGFAVRKYPWQVLWSLIWLSIAGWAITKTWFQFYDFSSVNDFLTVNSLVGIGTGAVGGFGLFKVFQALRLLGAQTYTKELLTYLKLPDYAKHLGQVNQMREDIRLMCDIALRSKDRNKTQWLGHLGKPKRLVFVIDDLDRCSPQGIVKTFDAVRLILDVPQVTVIIAIDHRIALAALANHYQELAEHHELNDPKAIARDYFGKMIHLPISLNEPNRKAIELYMRHLWSENPDDESSNWQSPFMTSEDLPSMGDPSAQVEETTTELKKETDKSDSISEEEGLTEGQLLDLILDIPDPEKPKIEERKNFGLTSAQKQGFLFWFDHFSFTNPRQQKRLENTYNLMRVVTGIQDENIGHELIDEDLPNEGDNNQNKLKKELTFGLMLALFLWEFVNSVENATFRNALTKFLNKDSVTREDLLYAGDKYLLVKEVNSIVLKAEEKTGEDLLKIAKNYVLPAIENYDSEASDRG